MPPGLVAESQTSSALNVVGLRTTVAPLDNLHVVVPSSSSVSSSTIRPAVGAVGTKGSSTVSSWYAVSSSPATPASTAASSSSVGISRPSRSGAWTSTTRSWAANRFWATAFSSSRVTVGISC